MTVPDASLRRANRAHVLVTGFGRFPGAAFNPTGPLARALGRIRRPAFAGVELVSHVFPTSYRAVDRELPELIARYRPLAIVMFGLAARVPQLRVETLAQNAFSRFPDAARFSPAARHIDTRAPNRLLSRVPAHSLLHAARMHGRPILSRDAGRYLCNYVYWRALEAAAKPGGPALVVFIHVPQPRRAAAPRSRLQGARTSPRQLTAMSEAILAAAVAATRTRH